jgi:hypothetical protein
LLRAARAAESKVKNRLGFKAAYYKLSFFFGRKEGG